MNSKEEILRDLKCLRLDRHAAAMMREDISAIDEDLKKEELPAVMREALEKEQQKLVSCLLATENRIRRLDRILALLPQEDQKVLDRTLISPYPEAVYDLAAEFDCETSSIYRFRARALERLARLRYGAGE